MTGTRPTSGLGDLDALMPPPQPTRAPAPAKPRKSRPTPVRRQAQPRIVAPLPTARTHTVRTRSQVFYLPDDLIEALDQLSRNTERSKSDLVREAVAKFLDSSEPSEAGEQ
jgi:hypothetical protein